MARRSGRERADGRPDTAGPVALRGPAGRPRAPDRVRGAGDPRPGRGPAGDRAQRAGRDVARRSRRRGPGPRHWPRLRGSAASLPGWAPACLAGVGSPGHAVGRYATARRRRPAGRRARGTPDRGRRPRRLDRPARVEPRGRPAFRVGRDGLVEPVRPRRRERRRRSGAQPRADGGGAGRPRLGVRPLLVRVRARRWDPGRCPRERAGPVHPDRPRRHGRADPGPAQ